MRPEDYIIVVIYLLGILAYGLYCSRELKNVKDFSVSTKRYGLFVVFATISASFIGGGFSTGNASAVFQNGIGNIAALWGFSLGQMAIGAIVAPRARVTGISPGGIMKSAYGGGAQVLTGVCSSLLCAGVLGAQIAAIGAVFNVLLGVNYAVGAVIGLFVILVYSTSGGMRAVVIIDVVQFLLLIVGMPLLLFFGVRAVGGMGELFASAPPSYFNVLRGSSLPGFVSLFLTFMIGEAMVPSFVQRMFIGKTQKTVAGATFLSGLVSAPFFVVTGLIGLCTFALNPLTPHAMAMPSLVMSVLPPGLRGLVIAAIVSVVMSSADSTLSSATIGFVGDILTPLSKKGLSERGGLFAARASNVLLGILGLFLALFIPDVLKVLLLAYTFWSPVILVGLTAAVIGAKATRRAFYASALAGGAGTVLWIFALGSPMGINGTIVGFFSSLIAFLALRKSGRSAKKRRLGGA